MVFNATDYTIGWICALEVELIAAGLCLDEEHDASNFWTPEHDDNVYKYGRIGRHAVVIAVLPAGEYGTSSAACAARDMIRTFTNLRVALMVGIGGGAPLMELDPDEQYPQRDIRLGDIVVGIPEAGRAGVWQYDYGKAGPDGQFLHTGHLNNPPKSLRTAVTALGAKITMHGHTIDQEINDLLRRERRLHRVLSRPPQPTDRLFHSACVHPSKTHVDCATSCSTNSANLVRRLARSEDDDNPAIHYGTIASGNAVIKDAVLRNRHAKEHGILCFEMEAAGLVNQFPFLVIRGICDYSDSHKSKQWQGYAAMTAAVYAKKLLANLPPQAEATDRLIYLEGVRERLGLLTTSVNNLTTASENAQLQQKMQNWLSAPDPTSHLNLAFSLLQEGTGQWLLNHPLFITWRRSIDTHLWLHGISGCGKTVLSSLLVKHLQESITTTSDTPIIFWLFDFKKASCQTFESMCRSLIRQIRRLRPDKQHAFKNLFDIACEGGEIQPSSDQLGHCLTQMLLDLGRVRIVIDALDECSTLPEALTWFEKLMIASSGVQLLVTSRYEYEIGRSFNEIPTISITAQYNEADVRTFVQARLSHKAFARWQAYPDVLEEAERAITDKADGMFRLAACQLELLETCFDLTMLRSTLATLPATLAGIYDEMLARVQEQHKPHAIRLLRLLTYAREPMSLDAIADALAVKPDQSSPYFRPEDRLPDPNELTRMCSGLMVVRADSSTTCLQLAHLSVKEYLLSNRVNAEYGQHLGVEESHAYIAKICLAYLCDIDFSCNTSSGASEEKVEATNLSLIHETAPLSKYAFTHVLQHVKQAPNNDELMFTHIRHVLGNMRHINALLKRDDYCKLKEYVEFRQPNARALITAAFLGLHGLFTHLLLWQTASTCEEPQMQPFTRQALQSIRPTIWTDDLNCALLAATSKHRIAIIQVCVESGAEATFSTHGTSALRLAYAHRWLEGADYFVNTFNENTARSLKQAGFLGWLLNTTASRTVQQKITKQQQQIGHCFIHAAGEGYVRIAELLLTELGRWKRPNEVWTRKALLAAATQGAVKSLDFLLQMTKQTNASLERALRLAAKNDQIQCVYTLLEAGVDPNASSSREARASELAATVGNLQVVDMLEAYGAQPLSVAQKEILYRAARNNHRVGLAGPPTKDLDEIH